MKARVFPIQALLVLACVLLAAAGCKKKDEVGPPLKAEVGALAIPAPVLGFASVQSLEGLSKVVSEVVNRFQPGLGGLLAGQVQPMLATKVLGVSSLSFLDLTKPIRVVMLDYRQFQNPLLLVASHRGADALAAGLPQTKAKGPKENEWSYGGPQGQVVLVNRLGDDLVVFSFHEDAFPVARPFLKELRRYPGAEVLDIQLAGPSLVPLIEPEIQKARDELQQMGAEASATTSIAQALQKELDLLSSLLRQGETVRLVLQWDGSTLALEGSAKTTAEGGLARLAADMRTRKMEVFRRLPGEATMIFASNLDPDTFSSWTDLARDFWVDSLQLNEEETRKTLDLWKRMIEAQDGDTAFYVGREGEFPFRLISVTAMKNGAEARETVLSLYRTLFQKAGAVVEKYAGPQLRELGTLDWTSLETLLKGLGPVLRTAGIEASIQEVAEGDLRGDRLDLRVDYTRVPGAADSPEVQQVAAMVGNRLGGALVFGPKAMYFALAKDAMGTIQEVAQGKAAGANPLDPVVQRAGFPVTVGLWVSLVDLLRLVAVFEPSLGAQMPGLAQAKAGPGISLIAGAPGERLIAARLELPLAAITSLRNAPAPEQQGNPVAPAP